MRRIRPRTLLAVCVMVYACSLTGTAQENARSARVRELNGRLLQALARVQTADATGVADARAEGMALIEQRARALALLAGDDPGAALQLVFSPALTARLSAFFPAAASQLEARATLDGPIEYIIEDDFYQARHRNRRTMTVEGSTVSLEFAGREPEGLKNGDLVRVTGVRVGNVLAVSDGSIIAEAADGPLTCSTLGQQNSIVLMVTMPPDTSAPTAITATDVHDTFFSPSQRSLSEYWRENSFGQTWAAGDVHGWLTLDRVYSCEETAGIRAAAIAAADPGVDFTQYTRLFIIVNGMTGTCTWGGLGTLACGTLTSADGSFTASTSWIRPGFFDPNPDVLSDGVQVAAHEGGHNIGLRHSNSRDYDGLALGPVGSAGVVTEYGDLFSAMGRLRNKTYPEQWIGFGHYTAPQKLQLGWLTDAQVPTISDGSGSFFVEPLEQPGGSVQAVRVVRGTQKVRGVTTTHTLWLEHRQMTGNYDSTLYPQVFTGALVHYQDNTNGGASHLLDFTPNVLVPESGNPEIADWSNPALTGTWADPYTGLSLTASALPAGLALNVTFGAAGCVRVDPTVTISPANPTALPGTNVTYTVSVTNNDSTACSSRTFTLSSSLPDGWATSFSAASLALAPTATGSVSMTKAVPIDAVEATHAINATATSSDEANSDTGNANCTVEPELPPLATTLSPLTTYTKNSNVPIAATVRRGSAAVPGASVLFRVTPPIGVPTTKTVVTDTSGRATWSFKIKPNDPSGTYVVTAVATLSGESSVQVSDDFVVP